MTEKDILEVLSGLEDNITKKRISEIVKIEDIIFQDEELQFRVVIPELNLEDKSGLKKAIETLFSKKGIDSWVTIVVQNPTSSSATQPQGKPPIQPLIPVECFERFKKIIAVYSTKGGVGKSTVAVYLAQELSEKGRKVAIIDLDIYGPSIPRILGTREKVKVEGERFHCISVGNIDMMSVGMLIPDIESPLIWRAPIANGVMKQIFTDTIWGDEYDILVIDMPPGTGDIPIGVGQSIPLDGLLAVSTPQGVALEDTVKGITMFKKFEIAILGIVKNMQTVICPDCKTPIDIFPINQEFDNFLMTQKIDILANLPLDGEIAKAADKGELNLIKNSIWKQEFAKITDTVIKELKL